jgi:hypothetical protein
VKKMTVRSVASATPPQPIRGFHLTMPLGPQARGSCYPYRRDNPRQGGSPGSDTDLTHGHDWESLANCMVISRFAGSGMHPHAKKWLTILHSPSIYISQDPRYPADRGL